MTNKKK